MNIPTCNNIDQFKNKRPGENTQAAENAYSRILCLHCLEIYIYDTTTESKRMINTKIKIMITPLKRKGGIGE